VLKISQKHLFPATLAISAAIIGFAMWRAGSSHGPSVPRTGFQGADVPLSMPANGEVDFRFHQLSAWQQAQVPRVVRLDPPLGNANGALSTVTRKFQEPGGEAGAHAGIDVAGIGGPNSSLGEPVHAAGNGLVLYAGEVSEEWGKVVVLGHVLPDGKRVQTLYGHLDKVSVVLGSLVPRGAKVGTVGTANGHHVAHLHFEVIEDFGIAHGTGAAPALRNRLDPQAVLAAHAAAADQLAPEPLARLMEGAGDGWTELEISNSERLTEILGKPDE
jgi:murein DD-endopeptidase MepM/ murein hydrolase activator NlpD